MKRMAEGITKQELLDRLAARFSAPQYAFFTEVGNAVGFPSSRMDALAMAMWRSLGLEIHGFEVKMYRGDWLRELRQPFKAEDLFSYCDRWWLLVADRKIVKDGELPPQWGLLAPRGEGLAAIVKPQKLSPQPLDREFLASILRKAFRTTKRELQWTQRIKSTDKEIWSAIQGLNVSLGGFEGKLERLIRKVHEAKAELGTPESNATQKENGDPND